MHIATRRSWGARHDDGFGNAPLPAREVWLHHSVTAAPGWTEAAERAAMRTLENIGESRFGRGVSYTWAVMPSGRVYEGHGVGRQGAHTKGRNSIARAIVLVGNYDVNVTTREQRYAVGELLRHAKAAGWIREAKLAGGHRQAPGASTACPGKHGMAAIPEMNRIAAGGSGPPPGPGPGPAPVGRPVLREGSTGPVVRALQDFARRTFPSYAAGLVSDGDFGPRTRAWVAEFQRRVGLGDDGVVGPLTWAALERHGYRG